MKENLFIKKGYNKDEVIQTGHQFLLGNGHIGYRGTLEEYTKEDMVGFNLVGVYDQYQDKWRESLNLPNPLFCKICREEKEISVKQSKYKKHEIQLDITNGLFKRITKYNDLIFSSTRFITFDSDLLIEKITIKTLKTLNLKIRMGLDTDIYESNGPHYVNKEVENIGNDIIFIGTTNEGKKIYQRNKYLLPENLKKRYLDGGFDIFYVSHGKEELTFYIASKVVNSKEEDFDFDYQKEYENHLLTFKKKWENSLIELKGNKEISFALKYSVYHLLILGDEYRNNSIPARGVSGQVYKGAIFWDTEMFMMPFYNLTNPHISRKLIEYRIKTLPGAISKAKEFGYQGAFYAWESQEDGLERCSKYNVTDPQTGEPIRTYFNEKQIHIDGAIVHAIDQYVLTTGDISILSDGGLSIIKECAKFYMSYSKKESDGLYHLNDVIGPDEYHERINDDAYTNYMAVETYKKAKKYLPIEDSMIPLLDDYVNHSYLPLPNEEGIIEQFNGYFELEDAYPNNLLSRLRFPNEYWGGENGVATKTKVIKQADVVALLSTLDIFNADIEKKNYDYYEPHTEHGSSLSSSMHSILASKLGYLDKAYEMFISSALIDIKGAKKQWAGGIYIGGTHPASNGGAYMSVVYGFLGMKINEEGLIFNPHLPKQIKEIKLVYKYKGKQYLLICNKKGLTTEEINHV